MATVFVVCCVIYTLVFRQYKLSVEKHHQLTELFNNPNVRVAHGDKAQQILEHVKSEQDKEAFEQKQKEVHKL
jgi:hypothetical protein